MILHRKRNTTVKSDINITPFTDVVLVLLIIFMITTPVLMQPNIEVNLPKTETLDLESNSNIEALISKEGYVYIEGKQVHSSNIEEVVRNLISLRRGQAIVIKGDEEVKYDYVIQFMDKAKKAGATKFALAVDAVNK